MFNDPGHSVWEIYISNEPGSYSAFTGPNAPPSGWSLLESPGFSTNLNLSMSFTVEDDDILQPLLQGFVANGITAGNVSSNQIETGLGWDHPGTRQRFPERNQREWFVHHST